MAYALELSDRQSTRTLEQAVRHRAPLFVCPRVRPDEEILHGRLVGIETPAGWRSHRTCLVAMIERVESAASQDRAGDAVHAVVTQDDCADLIGTYCDVAIVLGDHRYLFSADVVTVQDGTEEEAAARLYIAKPDTIQVAQRRRFWRFRPAQSSRVELTWRSPDGTTTEGIGWLCNVSADGLACRVDARVSDQIGIGEEIKVDFALTPGDPERFALDAVICNKTPAGTAGTIILGMQFLTGPGHDGTHHAADNLRRQLLARYSPVVDTSGG